MKLCCRLADLIHMFHFVFLQQQVNEKYKYPKLALQVGLYHQLKQTHEPDHEEKETLPVPLQPSQGHKIPENKDQHSRYATAKRIDKELVVRV